MQFAGNVRPIIRDIQAAGQKSLNAIAGQLNARKVATANGGQWRLVQVRLILDRAPIGCEDSKDEGGRVIQSRLDLGGTVPISSLMPVVRDLWRRLDAPAFSCSGRVLVSAIDASRRCIIGSNALWRQR